MIPIKNHRLFLDIASGVLKKRPDVHFVLVGDGPLKNELHTHAGNLGIADRVVFTGQRDDVSFLLTAFDVFLFTSSNRDSEGEGLPNAVMEAMVSGLPCVASRAGGTQELFQDGEAGYLVEPEAREAYLGHTLTLLGDTALRHSLGQAGRTIIQKKHSVSTMVSHFEDLYTRVLNGNTAH
jgi:glycosyltransferase involved in cell wall biosynthesis